MSDWVLIVAGGILQLPAVRAAHELGYKVAVTDRDLNCACAGHADHFAELDTFDVEGHVEFVKSWPYGFKAVFTAGADPVVTVARAAREAACHGLTVHLALICSDKFRIRDALFHDDVPQPRFWLAYDADDLAEKARGWSYPMIVKATKSSGSRGHTRISPGEDIDWLYIFWKAQAFSGGSIVLIEELLTGKELSVETVWYNGVMIPLNAVERPFLDHDRFSIELGHYNPAVLDPADYDAIWHVVEQAGRAVGIGDTKGGHIFKADIMLTDEGPKVLEVTPRLSGGFDSGWTSPLAHGVDYTKAALLLALGEPLEAAMPYFAVRWHRHAVAWAVLGPERGGVIQRIEGVEEARKYAEVILRFSEGDTLPPLEDCASRVAFCVTAHSDAQEAANLAKFAAEQIKVVCK